MARPTVPKSLQRILKSPTGQGFLAFVVGGSAWLVSGYLLASTGIQDFIIGHLTNARWEMDSWAVMSAMNIVSLLIMLMIVSAIAGAVMILVMNRLGLKHAWPVLRDVFIWCIVASSLVSLAEYATAFATNLDRGGVAMQTLSVYVVILEFGLPFAFAWLWATRGGQVLDRKRRKA